MSCNDQCQCGGKTAEPIITMRFTKAQADYLWATLQGQAERMATCLEARERVGAYGDGYWQAFAEHHTHQELADIAHRALNPAEYTESPPAEFLWASAPEVTLAPIELTITFEVHGGE